MIESAKNLTVDRNLLQTTSCDGRQPKATHRNDASNLASKYPERSKPLRLSVWLSLLVLALAFGVQSASAQTTWSLGYYFPDSIGGNPPLSAIEWSALTHVAMVGGNPNSDGSITLSDGFSSQAPALISAAHANSVKVLYSLTNLGITDTGWAGAASGSCTSGHLQNFVSNIMSTVNNYGFDGVDLDWEEAFNQTEISNLLSCLRSNLGTKLLSADDVNLGACATTGGSFTLAMIANLDRLAILTYDLNGTWEPQTWFNSPLYSPKGTNFQSVDSDIQLARSCAYPMGKVSIGIPFYSYLTSPSTGPYQSFGSSPTLTQIGYAQVSTNYGVGSYTYDATAHEPWRALNGSWIQWENAQSVTDKVQYAKTNGLGGWVIWVLGWDYLPGNSPQEPLLDAIGKAFTSQVPPPINLQIISVK